MTISRRDTILISVLMNVGLLVFLLIIAIHDDDTEKVKPEPKVAKKTSRVKKEDLIARAPTPKIQSKPKLKTPEKKVQASDLPSDEVDRVLQAYTVQSSKPPEKIAEKPIDIPKKIAPAPVQSQEEYKKVVVSEGDVLDRIARYNNTTVSEIKRINNLVGDRLRIGQVLLVPVKKTPKITTKSDKRIGATDRDAVYYEVKSGDNPWKIAHKFNINYDDILKLNNLDEQKARNLRVGDKIRIQ